MFHVVGVDLGGKGVVHAGIVVVAEVGVLAPIVVGLLIDDGEGSDGTTLHEVRQPVHHFGYVIGIKAEQLLVDALPLIR